MTVAVTLYTRADCCLCADMKARLDEVADDVPFRLSEVDVDSDPDLQARFGDSVPVLFVDGRKAFKYRATAGALRRKLQQAGRRRSPLRVGTGPKETA